MWRSNRGCNRGYLLGAVQLHRVVVVMVEGGGCDGHSCCHRLNYQQESDNCTSWMAIWIITSTRGEIKKLLSETSSAAGHILNSEWGVCIQKVETWSNVATLSLRPLTFIQISPISCHHCNKICTITSNIYIIHQKTDIIHHCSYYMIDSKDDCKLIFLRTWIICYHEHMQTHADTYIRCRASKPLGYKPLQAKTTKRTCNSPSHSQLKMGTVRGNRCVTVIFPLQLFCPFNRRLRSLKKPKQNK